MGSGSTGTTRDSSRPSNAPSVGRGTLPRPARSQRVSSHRGGRRGTGPVGWRRNSVSSDNQGDYGRDQSQGPLIIEVGGEVLVLLVEGVLFIQLILKLVEGINVGKLLMVLTDKEFLEIPLVEIPEPRVAVTNLVLVLVRTPGSERVAPLTGMVGVSMRMFRKGS